MRRARSLSTHTSILPLICRSRKLRGIGAHRTTTHTTEFTADEKKKQWAKTHRDRLAREPRGPKKKIRTLKPATPYICLRAFVRLPPGTIELSEMGTLFSSGHKTLYNWNFEVIFLREHYKIMGIVPARFSGPPDDRKNYENSWTPREGENREK